jgi:hypothetical protein
MSTADEIALSKSLERLRHSFERDNDVIALWEAIAVIGRYDKRSERKGLPRQPMPNWISNYLADSAEKIHRLWLGIEPADDRPVRDMAFDTVGKLRKVPQSDGGGDTRFRDERVLHVARAFGLAGSGWNAFQKHDRLEADADLLAIYDDPALQEDPKLRKEVHGTLFNLIQTQENASPASVRNRLSKARKRQNPT